MLPISFSLCYLSSVTQDNKQEVTTMKIEITYTTDGRYAHKRSYEAKDKKHAKMLADRLWFSGARDIKITYKTQGV